MARVSLGRLGAVTVRGEYTTLACLPWRGRVESGGERARTAAAAATPVLLIVDDEPAIRAALRRYFQRRGWRVEEVTDGHEALGVLRAAQPSYDVVLCDLCIPGLSGVELHDQLGLEAPHLVGRLVFSTGDITGPDAVALLARTSQPVLEKPFDLDVVGDLADRIRSAR